MLGREGFDSQARVTVRSPSLQGSQALKPPEVSVTSLVKGRENGCMLIALRFTVEDPDPRDVATPFQSDSSHPLLISIINIILHRHAHRPIRFRGILIEVD